MRQPEKYTCEEAFRRLDDYLDRTLSEEELGGLRAHLRECETCASEYKFEDSFLKDVRSKLQHIKAPPRLLDRISKALNPEES